MHDERRAPPLRRRRGAARRARARRDLGLRRRAGALVPRPGRRARRRAASARPRSSSRSELRSGYRVVVAFEHRGEAERARYNLAARRGGLPGRRAAAGRGRRSLFAEAALSDGFVSPELKLAVIPFRRLVHRRRAAAPAPARGPARGVHRPAGRRPRRPRGPRDRPLRRLRDQDGRRASPATTWSSSTAATDRVFAPTDQLAKITRYVGTGGGAAAALGAGLASAGRASRRGPAAPRASWRASC